VVHVPEDPAFKYHGYMSEMSNNCSLRCYGTVSRIVHVASNSPAGPFVRLAVVVRTFAHNPQIVRAPDGTFVLYHIGTDIPDSDVPDCAALALSGKCGHGSSAALAGGAAQSGGPPHDASVAYSASPYGPFVRRPFILRNFTNPSAVIFANASVLLVGRSGHGAAKALPLAWADHWNGTYRKLERGAGVGPEGWQEDPYIYRGERGYHLLTHCAGCVNGTVNPTAGANVSAGMCGGGHMYSTDGLEWAMGRGPAYTCALRWRDGTATNLTARQRPALLRTADGGQFLYSGVGQAVTQFQFSFTFVQQLSSSSSS
jgi:hypothetical protein